ncbi:MAG TPA: sigma 54-interacting transcriptional regulator [Myxococcales bacterium]
MPRLVALFGPRRGLSRDLEKRLLIGRSLEADLQLIDDKASREHCVIEAAGDGGAFAVRDLGSRNGTFLNGAALAAPATLKAGDQIGVGETVLVFEPDFDALPAKDGESTLVLTRSGASAARAGAKADAGALERAGELALRAAMAASPEAAAELVCEAATRSLSPRSVAVLLLSAGQAPRPLLARPAGAHLTVGRELLEAALRQGRPLALPEAQSDAERDEKTTRVRVRAGETLCAPFSCAGEPAGALCLVREKPFDASEIALAGALAAAAGPALGHAAASSKDDRAKTAAGETDPIAESASMKEALRVARAACSVPSTVLVRGETGTGKEEIARVIHAWGSRAKGPFVAVNCGAIPTELAESELFGHEKGAFTGAAATRVGVFEQADGGTLFLDEIGELTLPLQVKLLRVLQDHVVARLGGRGPIPVDVRVVAATHRDLSAMVKSGGFREDLFWRLNVVRVDLAPLRDRPEDVLPLAERFLAKLGKALGRRALGFTDEARAALKVCPWPGNARQLANALERALVLKPDSGPIGLPDLPPEVVAPEQGSASTGVKADAARSLGDLVKALEKEQIGLAMRRARGVKSAAAEALGISRPTLDRKIEEYGIDLFAGKDEGP